LCILKEPHFVIHSLKIYFRSFPCAYLIKHNVMKTYGGVEV
jgi:hypothetical protein